MAKHLWTRSSFGLLSVYPLCNRLNLLFVLLDPWGKKQGGELSKTAGSFPGRFRHRFKNILNEIVLLNLKVKQYSLGQNLPKNRPPVKKRSAHNTEAVCLRVCVFACLHPCPPCLCVIPHGWKMVTLDKKFKEKKKRFNKRPLVNFNKN